MVDYPADWSIKQLGEATSFSMGYAFSSNDFVPDGVPLIRMGNLYQNELDFQRRTMYLPKDFIQQYPEFVLKANDIILSMTGTVGKQDYGYAVRIPSNSPLCLLNQRVVKIEANELINSDFFNTFAKN